MFCLEQYVNSIIISYDWNDIDYMYLVYLRFLFFFSILTLIFRAKQMDLAMPSLVFPHFFISKLYLSLHIGFGANDTTIVHINCSFDGSCNLVDTLTLKNTTLTCGGVETHILNTDFLVQFGLKNRIFTEFSMIFSRKYSGIVGKRCVFLCNFKQPNSDFVFNSLLVNYFQDGELYYGPNARTFTATAATKRGMEGIYLLFY